LSGSASPQLENGHTRIANELLEAIINYPFSGGEFKIVFAIIRNTYGWKKKESTMSYGLIATFTGLDKRYSKKVVKSLIEDKVLLKENSKTENTLGLNKNYRQWRLWITGRGGVLEDTSKVSSQTPKLVSYRTPY